MTVIAPALRSNKPIQKSKSKLIFSCFGNKGSIVGIVYYLSIFAERTWIHVPQHSASFVWFAFNIFDAGDFFSFLC